MKFRIDLKLDRSWLDESERHSGKQKWRDDTKLGTEPNKRYDKDIGKPRIRLTFVGATLHVQ